MKFTNTTIGCPTHNILWNDHYVAVPYDCTSLTSLATSNVISAGTIIPANNATAKGILLDDVDLTKNPNGTIVIHGTVKNDKLAVAPTAAAITQLKNIVFVSEGGEYPPQSFAVTYDLNGATGTAVTDSSSPYSIGTSVTVKNAPTITEYPTGTTQFDKWNTAADGSGTSYAAAATFVITGAVKLYAIYKA